MSNSSDRHASVAARLVDAISSECAKLSEDIEQLGSRLSDNGGEGGSAWIRALQHFDRLSQHARAQSRLLSHLLRLMNEETPGEDVLRAVIAEVPLPETRHRLEVALGLPDKALSLVSHEPEFWPADPTDAESPA